MSIHTFNRRNLANYAMKSTSILMFQVYKTNWQNDLCVNKSTSLNASDCLEDFGHFYERNEQTNEMYTLLIEELVFALEQPPQIVSNRRQTLCMFECVQSKTWNRQIRQGMLKAVLFPELEELLFVSLTHYAGQTSERNGILNSSNGCRCLNFSTGSSRSCFFSLMFFVILWGFHFQKLKLVVPKLTHLKRIH